MRRFILKWAARVSLLAAFLFLAEFIFYYAVLTRTFQPVKADLITVFSGADLRVEKGYEIANLCLASFLVISPRTENQLKVINARLKKQNCYQTLIEERAQTTFQNALFVKKLILENKINSMTLVTNMVHMPRSYLLCHLLFLGRKIDVFPTPVEQHAFSKSPMQWSVRQKKIVYNEMLELWGSLFEMGLYYLTGTLPEKGLKQSRPISLLRSALLFEV